MSRADPCFIKQRDAHPKARGKRRRPGRDTLSCGLCGGATSVRAEHTRTHAHTPIPLHLHTHTHAHAHTHMPCTHTTTVMHTHRCPHTQPRTHTLAHAPTHPHTPTCRDGHGKVGLTLRPLPQGPRQWRCRSALSPGGRSPSAGPGASGRPARTAPPTREASRQGRPDPLLSLTHDPNLPPGQAGGPASAPECWARLGGPPRPWAQPTPTTPCGGCAGPGRLGVDTVVSLCPPR